MARSPLFGRRVHIAGSIIEDVAVATGETVAQARELVAELVKALIRRGANFVVPVDAEPTRKADGLPICFDWLVWRTLRDGLALRPAGVPGPPMIIAVQHHKTEDQIPESGGRPLGRTTEQSRPRADRERGPLEHGRQTFGGPGAVWRHPGRLGRD